MVSGTRKQPDLNEGKVIYTFDQGLSRTESTMGMLGTTINVFHSSTSTSLTLFGIKNKHFAIKSDGAQETFGAAETTVLEETKLICGYLCQKAVIIRDVHTFTVWFTDQVQGDPNGQEVFRGLELKGFPMEITSEVNGIVVHLVATEVSADVPANAFSLSIPEGYELITKEEIPEKVIESARE